MSHLASYSEDTVTRLAIGRQRKQQSWKH